MPGVDYGEVQSRVPMGRVLELLAIAARDVRGGQFRGPCPVHGSRSPRSRSFSADLGRGVCRCFRCGFAGNQIQLWATCKGMTVYEAAVDLCRQAGVEVPWMKRWSRGVEASFCRTEKRKHRESQREHGTRE